MALHIKTTDGTWGVDGKAKALCGRITDSLATDGFLHHATCRTCVKIHTKPARMLTAAREIEAEALAKVQEQRQASLARHPAGRSRVPGIDGPVRFRARNGKRKPSKSHRRGW